MIWKERDSATVGQLGEFEERFPSLRLAMSSRWVRRMAKWLGLLLFAIVCFTAFAPWQQFVGGSGRVVAYAPLQRRQLVQSPISGRVARWTDGIREGIRVEKGQMIVEIQDLDPDLLDRKSTRLNSSHTDISRMPSSA